jgi:adenylate cyclase
MSGEAPESPEGQAPTSPAAAVQPALSGMNDGAQHGSGHVHAHHSATQFRFLEQLKHRNIVRVGILYVIVCWLILEPVHVVFHMLEAPAWANRVVIVLMALGFPAILLFAWVYEVTPEGLKPTAEVDPKRSIGKLTGQRLNRAIFVAMAVALAYFAADKFWLSKQFTSERPLGQAVTVERAVAAVSDKSIAVLPFADLSEKKDQEYFGDGMAEEILDLLVKIPGLNVIGHTSSFQFKGQNADVRNVGRMLGAAYVLEGSVRKVGSQLRATAQLIRTRDGIVRWSDTYSRPFDDVLKLQGELAAGVARALEITVDSDTFQSHDASRNPEAYDLYLRGLHALDRNDREGFEGAANYFQQALDLDPSFAAAATRVGQMRILHVEFGFAPAVETYERARHSLETAIRLDPDSGVAHAWLGWIHMAYDWDWQAASAEMKEALRLSPRDPTVLTCAGRLPEVLGDLDEALRLMNSAIARDPLFAGAHHIVSGVYLRAGRLAEAEAMERRVLEINPTFGSGVPSILVSILLARGRPDEALALAQRAPTEHAMDLVTVYYALGRKADSDALLTSYTRDHAGDDAFSIAEAHASRGESDEALRWLDRAYAQKDSQLYRVKGDPLLKNLEPDPRFKAFLRKMKLPE